MIFRNYRGDIDVNIIDRFMPLLMEREEEGSTANAPVILYDHITFTFVNFSNLYCTLLSLYILNLKILTLLNLLYLIIYSILKMNL